MWRIIRWLLWSIWAGLACLTIVARVGFAPSDSSLCNSGSTESAGPPPELRRYYFMAAADPVGPELSLGVSEYPGARTGDIFFDTAEGWRFDRGLTADGRGTSGWEWEYSNMPSELGSNVGVPWWFLYLLLSLAPLWRTLRRTRAARRACSAGFPVVTADRPDGPSAAER